MERLVIALGVLMFVGVGPIQGEEGPSPAAFGDPPPEHRILKIIHGWPDDPAAQDQWLATFQRQGFGGVVCNVSFEGYLEDETRWKAFQRAVRQARAAGLVLWLYDEKGYPSGTAGGLVLQDHPEWQARGLLIAERWTDGEPVELPLPPGRLWWVRAFPVREDGTLALEKAWDLTRFQDGETVRWEPSSGRWRVLAVSEDFLYEGTHAAVNLSERLPYINLLEPEPVRRFLEVTHARYAERLGPDLGRWFQATFTDEPSLMSLFFRPMPVRVLPWAPNLPEAFFQRTGERLERWIPALVADVGPEGKRIRYAFWETVADLVAENYFGQIDAWDQAHGLLSSGHLLYEESLTAHVALYGDAFRALRRMSAPGIDCLTSLPPEVPWFVARLAASAADLDGRTIRMSETSDHVQRYRPPGDDRPVQVVSEAEIRGTLTKLFLGGITTITSYYSFDRLSDEQIRRLNRWAGRLSLLLRGGRLVTDLALLYPIESVWPEFVPARFQATDSGEALAVEETFRTLSETLYRHRWDFLYLDSRTLTEATVENGTLQHGDHRWRVLILPRVRTLPQAAWEKLYRFWETGGALIAVGARPENSPEAFPSAPVQRWGAAMFGRGEAIRWTVSPGGGVGVYLPAGTESLVPDALAELLEPDVELLKPAAPIRWTHRRLPDGDVYLIANDGPEPWSGRVRFRADRGEQWDPTTGTRAPISADGPISLSLEGYGAVLFRFPSVRPPAQRRPERWKPPAITYRSLPEVEPVVAAGKFVDAALRRLEEPRTDESPVWEAIGRLTQGGVDAFLFVQFRYSPPLDLSEAALLRIESWAPWDQPTSARLLVILRDADGGDYLAETSRPLNRPGWVRSQVSLDRFRLGGWSRDPNGRLDRNRIVAVSVGWGGYYGWKGERIRFRLRLPESCRLPSRSAP